MWGVRKCDSLSKGGFSLLREMPLPVLPSLLVTRVDEVVACVCAHLWSLVPLKFLVFVYCL